jgi:hypothetical protein
VDLALSFLNIRSSPSGLVNHEKPQSKQIETFGHAGTPGLSIFLLLEWMIISAVNSA